MTTPNITDLIYINVAVGKAFTNGDTSLIVLKLTSTDSSGRHYSGWLETMGTTYYYTPMSCVCVDGSEDVSLSINSDAKTTSRPPTGDSNNIIASSDTTLSDGSSSSTGTTVSPSDAGGVTVASVFDLVAMTTSPKLVFLNSWDGTDDTKGAAGWFKLDTTKAGDAKSDGGIIFVTAAGAVYRRDFVGGLNPQWYGAVGDGNSRKMSLRFSTLEKAHEMFSITYSLDQEVDWIAIQTISLSGMGIMSPPLHFIMCNDAVALDDNPLV